MKLHHILLQTSTGGLSRTHQVNEEQCSYSIDLELKVHEEDIGKDLLHRDFDDGLLNYLDEVVLFLHLAKDDPKVFDVVKTVEDGSWTILKMVAGH